MSYESISREKRKPFAQYINYGLDFENEIVVMIEQGIPKFDYGTIFSKFISLNSLIAIFICFYFKNRHSPADDTAFDSNSYSISLPLYAGADMTPCERTIRICLSKNVVCSIRYHWVLKMARIEIFTSLEAQLSAARVTKS